MKGIWRTDTSILLSKIESPKMPLEASGTASPDIGAIAADKISPVRSAIIPPQPHSLLSMGTANMFVQYEQSRDQLSGGLGARDHALIRVTL